MKELLKNNWLRLILVLVVGILIGKFIIPSSHQETDTSANQEVNQPEHQIWTCSMHPQIRQDGPGKCPICGMDLIPLKNLESKEDVLPDEVPMSESAMKLAEIQTMTVKKEDPVKEIRLLGKVKPDERLKLSQTIHIPGRIEKLYVNFTGEKVEKGQRLASIYSPELVTAQKELFEVLKDKATNPEFVNAARYKLRQWKLTDEQIAELERTKEIETDFDVLSDYSGYVMQLNAIEGEHVHEGQQLFQIVDLSTVWVLFEAYESDLPWIKVGDRIDIEVSSVPGHTYKGNVTFIDPFIDPQTRVAYVRVELSNPKTVLKPDMFANGIITSKLNVSKAELLVPKSAVLWTGKRAVVYVKVPNREHNTFIYREIILGEDAGDFYVVKDGLEEGEEIAVNGVFKIDAAAQLAGKKSMMNPTGGKTSTGHHHGGMKMEGMDMPEAKKDAVIDKAKVPEVFKQQLGKVLMAYLPLKDKLADDDADLKNEVRNLNKAIASVDMSLLLGDAHNAWMKDLNSVTKDLKLLDGTQNIEDERAAFGRISETLKDAVSKFGVKMEPGHPMFLEFCPMVNDNKGGYWFSSEEQIRNPYFGAKMLKCGSVEETYQ
ncbi:MAG: efflux RND transporter periplasmic adaptor subunit [Flavobacteriales bacterium]|nr:efflux RND transporter periplasmic adaptor subunit [Flavobacteriales bacterium]